ncbi:restriction endonuclease subunit S [Thiothrix lacustris]|uniref:Restriction endonuclease subunit S n=1 Tax=Thiothrix lacustris TaxID=525917 RepID=A0ABY9MQ94_9GAMM|nr:restriction endonuclease subunit S [Thiothrix lacustris]WML90814.1 restriction endonuclease subunit S [Thiothrix lacustris]
MTNATIPAGYKQTEVGIIPEDWGVESLGAIAQIERGKFTARPRNDPKYYGGHIPFIQTGDVANSNGLITCFSQTLNEKGLKVSKVFPAGTLFFTIAANIGDIGFSDFDTACPDSLVAIMPNQKINKFWLAQELKTRKRSFESLATHNAQMNINLEKLKPYLLPIPRIEEQTAIATVLSDVDALIASLNAQIAKKRDIKTATMQQLLTGKQRLTGFGEGKSMKSSELGEIPEDWEVVPLSGMVDIRDGTHASPKYKTEGIPLVTSKNLVGRIIDLSNASLISTEDADEINKRSKVHKGDILMSMIGTIGSAILVKDEPDFCIKNIALFKPKRINGQYLFCLMQSPFFQSYIADRLDGGIQKFISLSVLRTLLIIHPPIDEQEAIAGVLSAMDEEIAALEQRLAKTKAMKQGMMQELLTGRTRLV